MGIYDADHDNYSRSDDMRLILQSLDRIDERTEAMDQRLRDVEQKLNNGLSHSVETTERIVAEMKEEQERIKQETRELRRIEDERSARRKWITGIFGGVIITAAGVIIRLIVGG